MAIKYAILGLLSHQAHSGYDLKKRFAEAAALYWSGNNNQIYRTLLELLEEELVTKEVHAQEKLPARKVYSITEKGRVALQEWVRSVPEPPEVRNTFLIQLMWAGQLERAELQALLEQYEHEVHMRLLMERERARRGGGLSARTPLEARLWESIQENIAGFYERELDWAKGLRRALNEGEAL